jgi:hypothetical protein
MRAVVLLLLAGSLVACENLVSRDYLISPARPRDVQKVARILRAVASEVGLRRSAPTPYDSPVITLYKAHYVDLRAFDKKREIRVSLTRYWYPPPAAFTKAEQLLRLDLSREFGWRFTIEPPPMAGAVITVY